MDSGVPHSKAQNRDKKMFCSVSTYFHIPLALLVLMEGNQNAFI